jgi:hypothetical protein
MCTGTFSEPHRHTQLTFCSLYLRTILFRVDQCAEHDKYAAIAVQGKIISAPTSSSLAVNLNAIDTGTTLIGAHHRDIHCRKYLDPNG